MTTTLAPPVAPPETHEETNEERLAKVHTALSELNDLGSWRSIESYFEERGIRGVLANSAACPVATYILITTGIEVVIDGRYWWAFEGFTGQRVPDRVGRFIRDFDMGEFPELQLPGTPVMPVVAVVPARIEEDDRD